MRWHGLLTLLLLSLCGAGVFAVTDQTPGDAVTTALEHGHRDAQSDIPARGTNILKDPPTINTPSSTFGDAPSGLVKSENPLITSTKDFSEVSAFVTTPNAVTGILGTNVPEEDSKVSSVVLTTAKPVIEQLPYDFEEHAKFGTEVVDNEEGIGHCDPAFPPPLHHEKTLNEDDYPKLESIAGSSVGSLRTKSISSEINISELKNGSKSGSNNDKTEEHSGERKRFSVEYSNETIMKKDISNVVYGFTEIMEVLPTAAAFKEKQFPTQNNKHERDDGGATTFENPKSFQEGKASRSVPEAPIAEAQIRRLDDNKFAFPIPSIYDLEHSTTETSVRKDLHEGDDLSSRVILVRNKSWETPPSVPQPSAVRFTPTHVHRYDFETEQEKNEASTAGAQEEDAAAAAAETTAKPTAGKPRGRLAPSTPDPPPAPTLEFPPPPLGEDFRVNDLGLSDGVFVFKYLGSFLSWIQPYDFPVELLRDALWKRVSIANLIGQSLPVEAGFIACLCVGVTLALAAPLYALCHACCSLCRRRRDASSSAAGASWDDDSSSEASSGCRRRALLFMLDVILLLMVGGVVAMFVTNEQLSGAVSRFPATIHTALGDAATFLRNTNLQLHFVVTKSLDRAVEAVSTDLDNVESLLGKPIQRQLEEETGVGVALDALVDVTTSAQDVAGRVAGLLERAAEARGLALVAQERLADLRLQVDALRRQCPTKDRSLCDTVEAQGLSITMYLDGLLADERLGVLRRLAEGNLSATAQQARGEFLFIPTHVEQQTRDARSGVRRQLLRQRGLLDDSAWALDALSRELGAHVDEARERALRLADAAADVEYWRYMAAIGMAAAVLLLWSLLLAALSCGCCGAEEKARPTLFTWVGVLCPVYLALWAAALLALLVGGHGEVFVCRPLYDEPGFEALTALLDRPGVLFQRRAGFFANMVHGNTTLDVPLKEALRACEQNRPSYPAFRLQQVLDVDTATDHRRWEMLHRQLGRLQVDLSQLQLLTPQLQMQLTSLLNAAHVNLTSHRTQLSRPVTGKDLTTFADQLESVANQITDLPTASRLETLASRTRRLLASHMDPLKQRKEDLVYQLTALEVQLVPLQRQVNQSLSHLKTIQFFINNQGSNISHTKSNEYADRLVSYIQQYREHVMRVTSETAAPCRPLWDSFHAVRQLLCRHIMDPLNGFWFGAVWCLVLLLVATPLAVRLGECYPRSRAHTLLHRSAAETPPDPPVMPEQATWSTPGYVHKMYRTQSSDTINTDSYELYDKKF